MAIKKLFKRLLLYVAAFFVLFLVGKDPKIARMYQKKLDQL